MRFLYLLRKKRFWILLIITLIFVTTTSRYFDDAIFEYVNIRAKAYFEDIVNQAIREEIVDCLDEKLMEQKYDSEGNLIYAYLDAHKALMIKSKASERLKQLVTEIKEDDGFDKVEIPFGYFFTKNVFMTNGIKIPVKLNIYKAYESEIDTNVTEYGINSTFVEIFLKLKYDAYIQIPFQKDNVTLETNILLSAEIINSDVPNFYFGG